MSICKLRLCAGVPTVMFAKYNPAVTALPIAAVTVPEDLRWRWSDRASICADSTSAFLDMSMETVALVRERSEEHRRRVLVSRAIMGGFDGET